MKILLLFIISVFLTGSIFTSCKKDPVSPKPCDTCNLNQDSLAHVRDSLAHAFNWTEYVGQIYGETNLTGVWIFGQNDIYIVGNSLWHFDGTNFTVVPAYDRTYNNVTMNSALNGNTIFAFSKNDFWMVYRSVTYHSKDGEYFDDFRPADFNACWGTSSTDMFFVGNGGNIYHYDGSKFSQMTSNTTKDLRSVWGTSSNDVWACGFNSSTAETILLHYDGSSWSEDPISMQKGIYATGGFDAVWACDSAGHKFVTTSGAILIRKTDNELWRSDSGLISNSLGGGNFIGIAPSGNNANDFMVLGPWGFISHWNGKTWKQYTQFYDYSNNDYYGAAFSMNANTACIVGTKGGASWVLIGQRSQ